MRKYRLRHYLLKVQLIRDVNTSGATPEETAELLGQSDTRSLHRYASLDSDRMRLCPLSLGETELTMERGWYNA